MNNMLPEIEIDGEHVQVTGRRHCLVLSRTYPGEHYVVDQGEDCTWHCACKGWQCRQTCRHVTKVKAWLNGDIEAHIIDI